VPDNERAEEMAKHFYAGEADYQSDARWMGLVEEADRELLVGTSADTATGGVEGWPTTQGPAVAQEAAASTASQGGAVAPAIIALRAPVASLSREYRDDLTNLRWDVSAFAVAPNDPDLGSPDVPWRLKATTSGIFEFLVQMDHEVFRSATLTPLDGLLAELAWAALDFYKSSQARPSFSQVLALLRSRYAGTMKLDPVELASEARLTIAAVARGVSDSLHADDANPLFAEFSPAEQETILSRMAARAVQSPQSVISTGHFLEYAPGKMLLRFFGRHPELFFDGRYWDVPYGSLDFGVVAATEEAQSQVTRYYSSLLADAIWLSEQDPGDLSGVSRPKLLRAALALELLEPSGDRSDGDAN
jgi:hypothetical protein